MAPVMCYICGREFGSSSIQIHIPQCQKKWEHQQSKLPKSQRRPIPERPETLDKIIGTGGRNVTQEEIQQYNQQAFDDFNNKALEPCLICGRTFLPRALEIHSRSCKPKSDQNSSLSSRREMTKPSTSTKKENKKHPHSSQDWTDTSNSVPQKSDSDKTPSKDDLIYMIQKERVFDNPDVRKKMAEFIAQLK